MDCLSVLCPNYSSKLKVTSLVICMINNSCKSFILKPLMSGIKSSWHWWITVSKTYRYWSSSQLLNVQIRISLSRRLSLLFILVTSHPDRRLRPVWWSYESDLSTKTKCEQNLKIIVLPVVNLVTLKAGAKNELLFNEPEMGLLNIYVGLKQHNKVWAK